MKKIFISLLLILSVGAVAIGATQAYFTDTQTVTNNIMTAGKVDIDLRGAANHRIVLDTTQSFRGGLVPGSYDPTLFNLSVYNKGWGSSTIPVKYRMSSQFVSESKTGYWDHLLVIVRHSYAGRPDPASWPVVYEGLLKDLNVNSIDNFIADFLEPNITHEFYFQYGLDSPAGNIYQGANAQFNIVVDATQSTNPGWTE